MAKQHITEEELLGLPPKNRHDVDRLGDIRAEIRRLEAEDAAIRERLIRLGKPLIMGDEYVATVSGKEHPRFDVKAAMAWLGKERIGQFMKTVKTTYVKVTKVGDA